MCQTNRPRFQAKPPGWRGTDREHSTMPPIGPSCATSFYTKPSPEGHPFAPAPCDVEAELGRLRATTLAGTAA